MQAALRVLAGTAGLALFAVTIRTIVGSMLVPRPRTPVVADWVVRFNHWAFRRIAFRRSTFGERDAALSAAGPATILLQLVVFVLLFVVSGALIVYAISGGGAESALYQSASSLFTLGIVEPAPAGVVAVGLVAAFVGLVVVAILVGYLLALYSAFSQQESIGAAFGTLAGEPAWGPELICRSALLGEASRDEVYARALSWVSDLRLNHTVYPVLKQFRSTQPHRHWLVTLVALLDAAALELTTVADGTSRAALVRCLAEGTETLSTLTAAAPYRLETPFPTSPAEGADPRTEQPASAPPAAAGNRSNATGEQAVMTAVAQDGRSSLVGPNVAVALHRSGNPGVTREQWDYARTLLRAAGVPLRPDADEAWRHFAAVRSSYARNAYILAQLVYATPAPWTGERFPATETVWPHLAAGAAVPSPPDGD
ncbi:MAG: hypothetical protein E6Q90_12145 [Actinobacteria bacterium]|nr:MAG: hypothetical protein E6Q90_12145 [Actinomycetota bacterium]